ncbi:MAG: acyltransferase family protein [Actinomycetota bacterium]|nr:acyltransferase family protein [Actinomycetota bacterium]
MSERRLDIQGMRALAVLAVVAYHAGAGFSGGYVGVDVFFVISGYVITRMMLAELGPSNTLDFRRFYQRRVRRLLPALALMLGVVLVLSPMLVALQAQVSTARTGASAALVNANNYLTFFGIKTGYFALDSKSNPLLHTWSLSVEEQFYLVFPLLIWASWRVGSRFGRPRAGVFTLATIVAISFPLSIALRHGIGLSDFTSELAFYSAPARAWEFAIGGLVAVAAPRMVRLSGVMRYTFGLSGLVLVAVATFVYDDSTVFPDFAVIVPVVGTALLIAAGEGGSATWVARILSLAPLRRIGDVSYGWYLWHWPLIVFAAAMWPSAGLARSVAAVLSLGVAFISYRWLEEPIRHVKSGGRHRTLLVAAVCVVAPLAAAVSLEAGHHVLLDTSIASAFAPHLADASGCDSSVPLERRDTEQCVWEYGVATNIVLIGDSNAGQFSEGMRAGAQRVGARLTVATYSSCPFVPFVVWQAGDELTECRKFVEGSLRALISMRPDAVYLASSSDAYIGTSIFEFAVDGESARVVDPTAKAEMWQAGLAQIVDELTSAGIRVVVIHPVPKFASRWRPVNMAPLRLLGFPDGATIEISRVEALGRRQRAVDAEDAATKLAGASTIDPFDQLCPGDPCRTRVGSTWMYRDDSHISVAASEALGAWFAASLKT